MSRSNTAKQLIDEHKPNSIPPVSAVSAAPEALDLKFRKRISLFLLALASLGIIITWTFSGYLSEATATILMHAFEGALVGGLCDWFAVKKTYKAIQDNHSKVADGIGRYIKQEILNASVIQSRLNSMLDSSDSMRDFREKTGKSIGSQNAISNELRTQWKKISPHVYDWIAKLDLSESSNEALNTILSDKLVTQTAKECLIAALKESIQKREFKDLEKVFKSQIKILPNFVLPGFESILQRLESEQFDEEILKKVFSALAIFRFDYFSTWNKLSKNRRRNAAQMLLEPFAGNLINIIAEVIVAEKEKIRGISTLRSYSPARIIIERLVESLNDDHMDILAANIVYSLKRIDTLQFASNFESHTRLYLEIIRINGTILGFALGGLIGIAANYLPK